MQVNVCFIFGKTNKSLCWSLLILWWWPQTNPRMDTEKIKNRSAQEAALHLCSNLSSSIVDSLWKSIHLCYHIDSKVSDCLHLSTAHRPCASWTTATATQSATPAQTAVWTSRWEVTFGLEMWCTVRSTPNRGTKAQVPPPKPPCPLANESALPHPSLLGRRVLLVCLKNHLLWLSYRPWDGARRHWSAIWQRMIFSDPI